MFSRYKIKGKSMEPSLKDGDRVLTSNFLKPKKGDIVIIKKDSKEIVKRIEQVSGNLFYVLGENRKKSTDSRQFGLVTKHEILGKVLFKY